MCFTDLAVTALWTRASWGGTVAPSEQPRQGRTIAA